MTKLVIEFSDSDFDISWDSDLSATEMSDALSLLASDWAYALNKIQTEVRPAGVTLQ